MPSVDKRVVEMQFNNKQFESGVSTTLKSLQKLKDELNFKKATQSMNELENAGKRFNLSGVAKGVEAIQSKFSALGIIGVTTLVNLTNQAVDAGKRIASALTIDPIKTGFQEYETQINAVQTILANTQSKGTNLKQVNEALNELNKYADMTIYNFTEMTRNIGTFTAAGVDLDTSVSAIKGIANLAAVSGSTSQQASTAMYQLSQALAAGTVKLMDWNSVVNAGMGGQVFQDALKETARVHNIKIDEMIEKEGSFRETLKNGWLTSAILTETLAKFTGDLTEEQLKAIGYNDEQIKQIIEMGKTANDAATKVKTFTQLFDTLKEAAQSGWTQSWQYIIGDFEEAKGNLTRLSDYFSELINNSAETRNKMLADWAALGGSGHLFDGIIAIFDAILSFVNPLKEGFREIIPPITGQQLANVTQKFKEFAEGLKLSEENANRIKNIGRNIANVFKPILSIFKGLIGGLPNLFKGLGDLTEGLLSVVEVFTGFIGSISQGIDLSKLFSTVLSGIGSVLTFIAKGLSVVSAVVAAAVNGIASLISYVGVGFVNLMSGLGVTGESVMEIFDSVLSHVSNVIENFFTNVKEFAINIAKLIPEFVGTAFRSIGEAISNILQSFNIESIMAFINSGLVAVVLNSVDETITTFKDKIENLDNVLTKFLEGPVKKFDEVLTAVKDAINAFTLNIKVDALLKIAVALAVLAFSIWKLSKIPIEDITSRMGILAAGLFGLVIALSVIQKVPIVDNDLDKLSRLTRNLASLSITVLILSVAIEVLGKTVETLSKLSWEELAKGISSVALLSGVIIAMTRFAKNTKGFIKTAAALVILSIAIRSLVSSVTAFGQLSLEELVKGLGALAATLSMIVAAVYGFSKVGKMSILSAAGLLILSVALKNLSSSVAMLGSLSVETLVKGLLSLAASLLIMIAATDLMSVKARTALSFMIFVVAIRNLSNVIKELGSMSVRDLAKSLLALASSLAVIIVAMRLMKASFKSAIVFTMFAMALAALTVPIKVLGEMSLENLSQGLIGLAAALTIVGVAAKTLGTMTFKILKTSFSLTVFSVALVAFGVGLMAIIYPIKKLSEIGIEKLGSVVAGIGVIVGSLYLLAQTFNRLPSISPKALVTLGVMIVVVGLIGVLLDVASMTDVDSGLKAAEAIAMVLLSVSAALFILALMPLPAAASAIVTLAAVIAAMSAIVAAMGYIAQIPGAKWIIEEGKVFMQSIGEAIGGFFGGIAGGAISAVASSLPGLGTQLSEFATNAEPFFNSMKGFDSSVADGVKNLALAFLAITATNVLDSATSWLTGGNSMVEFGKQLAEFAPYLKSFGDSVAGIDGSTIEASANAAKALAEMADALPKEGGLAQFFTGIGDMDDFGSKIVTFGETLKSYGDATSGIDTGSIEASASAAQALVDVANALPKEGGIFQMFTGENDLATFGTQLVSFGDALKSYGIAVANIDARSIKSSAEAAQGLVDVYNALDKSGGVIGFFEGEQDFSSFSSNLEGLGDGLKKYGEAVSGIDPEKTKASVEVARGLADIKNVLGTDGGNVFTVLSGLSSALGELGPAIAGYANSLGEASFDKVGPSVDALSKVKDVVNGMNDFNGEGITRFADTIGNLGDIGLSTFNEQLQATSDSVSESMSTLANSISTGAGQIGSAFDDLKSKLQTEVDTYKDTGKNIGLSLDQGMANGLGEGSSEPINKIKEICNQMSQAAENAFSSTVGNFKSHGQSIAESALAGMSGYRNSFYQAGLNMAQGVVDGINSGKWGVANAAATLALQAAEKFKASLDINSPSKVFMRIAKCIPEGVGKGISKWTSIATDSTQTMANKTFDVAKNAMSRVSDLVENPTPMLSSISPVYVGGTSAELKTSATMTSHLVNQLGQAIEKFSNNQNGSGSVVNNYDNSMNVSLDGITINDNPAMRQATKDYLIELHRLGAM